MTPPPSGLRWLYVDFNSYFASVEQQDQPRLRGRPVAVVPVDTDFTSAIAASYEAKAYGVRTGTMIRDARRMCPGLICVPARHDLYVDYHHRALAEIGRHIPVTAVCSIDEAACRLMDNEAPTEVAVGIARSIKRGLAANVGAYVRCSIGIAPNRYLAKVATDLQKPDGLTVLHPWDLPHRLLGLTLRDLPGVGASMEKRLLRADVPDMATLLAQDARRLREIWGSVWGERMWQLLRGVDLPEIETARRTVGHSHVMAPEFRPPEQAIHIARRLTLKAASRLRRMDYYAGAMSFSARLECGLRFDDHASCWRAQDSCTFLDLLDAMWTRCIAPRPTLPIKKVAVTLYDLQPAASVPPDLFDQPCSSGRGGRLKSEKISRAMDQLNQRFGRDTVLVGMLPRQGQRFSGVRIAFTRIPDLQEFRE